MLDKDLFQMQIKEESEMWSIMEPTTSKIDETGNRIMV